MKNIDGIQRIGSWCVIWEVVTMSDDFDGSDDIIVCNFKDAQNAAKYVVEHNISYGVQLSLCKPEWIKNTKFED